MNVPNFYRNLNLYPHVLCSNNFGTPKPVAVGWNEMIVIFQRGCVKSQPRHCRVYLFSMIDWDPGISLYQATDSSIRRFMSR